MRFLFWRKNKGKLEELNAIEQKAALTHKENIGKITKAREKSDKLKAVLKQNNITIELAKAIGH
jgi:hypothetical protein